jgi:hypothetical protein
MTTIINDNSPNAILPFLTVESGILNRNNSASFELKLNPADPYLPKVKTSVHRVNGEEIPCEIITWANTLHAHNFPGLGVTTGPLQKAVLNNVIEGINRIIFMENLDEYTMANHRTQAILVYPDRTHPNHLAVLQETIELADHATSEAVHSVIWAIITGQKP